MPRGEDAKGQEQRATLRNDSRDAPNADRLVVYTDSDWDTLNGTTGTCHILAGTVIAHNSKKVVDVLAIDGI